MSKSQTMILVPIDFTEQSLIALREAENLAKTSKAELTLLSVIEESGFFCPEYLVIKLRKKLTF